MSRKSIRLVSVNDKAFVVYLNSICSIVELNQGFTVINVINGGSFTVSIPIDELEALIIEQENAKFCY